MIVSTWTFAGYSPSMALVRRALEVIVDTPIPASPPTPILYTTRSTRGRVWHMVVGETDGANNQVQVEILCESNYA